MRKYSLIYGIIGFSLGFMVHHFFSRNLNYQTDDLIKLDYHDTTLLHYEKTLNDLNSALDSANKFANNKVIENIQEKSSLHSLNNKLSNENRILIIELNESNSIIYDSLISIDTTYIRKN